MEVLPRFKARQREIQSDQSSKSKAKSCIDSKTLCVTTMSEDSSSGQSGSETQTLPEGKRIPLNSRRLPAAYLKLVGEALRLPTSGSSEELRQMVEGKLTSEKDVEVSSVQVVAQETHQLATQLWLVDSEGVILETSVVKELGSGQAWEPEEPQLLEEELRQLNEELEVALEEVEHLKGSSDQAQEVTGGEAILKARITK